MFLSSLDIYEAWYYVWYAWLAAVLQRVASVAFGREIVAHSKPHTSGPYWFIYLRRTLVGETAPFPAPLLRLVTKRGWI